MSKEVKLQSYTQKVSVVKIMKDSAFMAGVEDVRTGRPTRFDEYSDTWEYERGRQWAMLAPMTMPLRVKGRLNPQAVELLLIAFGSKAIT